MSFPIFALTPFSSNTQITQSPLINNQLFAFTSGHPDNLAPAFGTMFVIGIGIAEPYLGTNTTPSQLGYVIPNKGKLHTFGIAYTVLNGAPLPGNPAIQYSLIIIKKPLGSNQYIVPSSATTAFFGEFIPIGDPNVRTENKVITVPVGNVNVDQGDIIVVILNIIDFTYFDLGVGATIQYTFSD